MGVRGGTHRGALAAAREVVREDDRHAVPRAGALRVLHSEHLAGVHAAVRVGQDREERRGRGALRGEERVRVDWGTGCQSASLAGESEHRRTFADGEVEAEVNESVRLGQPLCGASVVAGNPTDGALTKINDSTVAILDVVSLRGCRAAIYTPCYHPIFYRIQCY